MNKKIFLWGGVTLFLVIAIGILIAGNRNATGSAVPTFSAADPNGPRISAQQTEWDLGEVPFESPTFKEVSFTNSGKSKLNITGALTSCGCTSVTFLIPGKEESPKFEMHNNPKNWTGEVEPGQTVTMKVKFDPKAHSVHGQVERTIVVSSNDPVSPNFEFKFKANVTH